MHRRNHRWPAKRAYPRAHGRRRPRDAARPRRRLEVRRLGCAAAWLDRYGYKVAECETGTLPTADAARRVREWERKGKNASWCPHCESLIEDMQQLDNFAAIRKNLFTVSEDSTIEEASVHEGDFPIYIDQDKAVYDQYELEHIPSVFILDDQGNIIGSAEGEKESLALLKKYAEYNG